MRRTLGIHCDPHCAHLAVVEDEAVVDCGKHCERLLLPPGEESQALNGLLDDSVPLIRSLGVEGVSILLAETADPRTPRKHTSLVGRTTMETVMRLAAVRAGVAVELTPRATAKARLGLPRKGNLEAHLSTLFQTPVGRYWTTGRGLAAMAALALGRT